MQMNEYQFLQIYNDAYRSMDSNKRSENSNILNTFIYNNSNQFVYLSCNCLKNENLSLSDKVLIIVGLTKALRPNSGGQTSIWDKLNESAREELKNSSFTILIHPNDDLKHKAGNLIAGLYVLDLKDRNNWGTDFIQSLSDNVNNEDSNIQKAAIITIGYICENLFNDHILTLGEEEVDLLLGGICKGVEVYGPLSKTSVTALGYSISFLKPKLNDEKILDYIFDILVKLLISAFEKKDVEVLTPTISCLEEISRVVYPCLGKYHQLVFNKVLNCTNIRDDKNLYLTINEFFKTLMETEKDYKKRFFDNFWENIANYCLESLLMLDESIDDEEGGLSLKDSFFLLINTINYLYISQTQTNLLKFVYQYIESPDPKTKVVSLLVFESLLESSTQKEIEKQLNDCFEGVMNLIQDSNYLIQKQAMHFLLAIIKYHFYILKINNNQNFIHFNKNMFALLNTPVNNSEKKIKIRILVLKIIEEAVEKAKENSFAENFISYIEHYFEIIIKSLNNCENLSIISESFSVIFVFIAHVCPLKFFSMFYKFFQIMMIETPQKFQKKEVIFAYIESVEIVLTTMLNKIAISENFKFTIDDQNPNMFMFEGYKFVESICLKYNDLPEESLYFMAHVLKSDPKYFKNEVNQFVSMFIKNALKDFQKLRLFKNAVDAFLIIIKGYPNESLEIINDIIPLFLSYLQNPEFDRELNTSVFYAFSDIIYLYPSCLIPHINDLFTIISFAKEAILHFFKVESKFDNKHAEVLLDTLNNLVICIVHGVYLNENNEFYQIDQTIEINLLHYITFLEQTCVYKNPNDSEFFESILGFMLDFYQKKKNSNFLNRDFIEKIINCLSKNPDYKEDSDIMIYYKQTLLN
jgi:hypothetical protein